MPLSTFLERHAPSRTSGRDVHWLGAHVTGGGGGASSNVDPEEEGDREGMMTAWEAAPFAQKTAAFALSLAKKHRYMTGKVRGRKSAVSLVPAVFL